MSKERVGRNAMNTAARAVPGGLERRTAGLRSELYPGGMGCGANVIFLK